MPKTTTAHAFMDCGATLANRRASNIHIATNQLFHCSIWNNKYFYLQQSLENWAPTFSVCVFYRSRIETDPDGVRLNGHFHCCKWLIISVCPIPKMAILSFIELIVCGWMGDEGIISQSPYTPHQIITHTGTRRTICKSVIYERAIKRNYHCTRSYLQLCVCARHRIAAAAPSLCVARTSFRQRLQKKI